MGTLSCGPFLRSFAQIYRMEAERKKKDEIPPSIAESNKAQWLATWFRMFICLFRFHEMCCFCSGADLTDCDNCCAAFRGGPGGVELSSSKTHSSTVRTWTGHYRARVHPKSVSQHPRDLVLRNFTHVCYSVFLQIRADHFLILWLNSNVSYCFFGVYFFPQKQIFIGIKIIRLGLKV